MGALLNPATIQLALSIITDAPSLIETLKSDVAAVSGGTLTIAQFDAQWAAMSVAWNAAKAKWAAA